MIFPLLFALSATAAVLTSTPGKSAIEEVKIAKEAKLKVAAREASLPLVGAGLRYKKVAFIKAKVYVGEFFADAPEKVTKTADGVLASLAGQKTMVMRMTFLRDVDGGKVSGGFREALEENKVNLESGAIKEFLAAVKNGGEVKEHQTLTVVGERLPGGKEAISYENGAGQVVTIDGAAGLVQNVFSMWFGKIDDSGLENLKDEILGLKN